MYNRERFIGRAIKSCLNQSFLDFEIVVVDDGSTDKSAAVVEEFTDPRIRLIRHETNQERLIARNTGARAARGEWLVWFDSDDELVPEALEVMKKRITELSPDVSGLRFMCKFESGQLSPDLPYSDEIWDYEAFIRWVELHYSKRGETLPVVQRCTMSKVIFPEDKFFTGETQYHLDFAAQYKTRACKDVLRIYHSDADNKTANTSMEKRLTSATATASRLENIIGTHGGALLKWAPRTYYRVVGGLITQYLFSGQRNKALQVFSRSVRVAPFSVRLWAIVVIGLISPHLLARLKVYVERRIFMA